MNSKELRVLCLPGIGDEAGQGSPQPEWEKAIGDGLRRWNFQGQIVFEHLSFQELFAKGAVTSEVICAALLELGWSGVSAALGISARPGGLSETLRWTAGMVAQWAADAELRQRCRDELLKRMGLFKPDVVCAHSLGSLVAYDAFARTENHAAMGGRTLVTAGSQIENPFIRNAVGGRIEMVPGGRWYFVYNPHDGVFTKPLYIASERFTFVEAAFQEGGFFHHDALAYFRHSNTVFRVWREIAEESRRTERQRRAPKKVASGATRRALLVGINAYPAENRLQGCANDVYLMSAMLQEAGFAPAEIRVVLDERATCQAIVDRLAWLFDGAQDGDTRVFYFSGHGAQLPSEGRAEGNESIEECLAPVDFDWTREHAITDEQFYSWYSQLPYGTNFWALLDCCHSGGMARSGGFHVRGLDPPDDIRHRQIQWNAREQMWEERSLPLLNASAPLWKRKTPADQVALLGRSGAKSRLGRSSVLRRLPDAEYDAVRRVFGHRGPYLPMILQASQEDQYAFEYKHGLEAYGAFTYALVTVLRAHWRDKRGLTWGGWVSEVERKLRHLGYAQTPVVVCPAGHERRPAPSHDFARRPMR